MDMMLAGIVGLVIGAASGVAIAFWRLGAGRAAVRDELANIKARAQLLDSQIQSQVTEMQAVRQALQRAEQAREEAQRGQAVAAEQLMARQRQFEEQSRLLAEAEKKLGDTFAALGSKALHANNEQFMTLAKKTFEALMTQASGDVDKKQVAIDALVKPIRELLDTQNLRLTELEQKRETAYARLDESIKQIALSHDGLRSETSKLVSALRKPDVRGRWGELQLRNVVELAGMTAHCDFVEQESIANQDGALRPDMVVRIPGGGRIVVDSKVALEAYLDMLQPDADRDVCMKRHLRHVSEHFRALAAKKYWDQFERAPKLVVMFMPLESALSAALEVDPDLHAEAMRSNVIIATPTLLVALLRAVAYGWQQEDVAANARQISETGRELYERLAVFAGHFEAVGKNLTQATSAFNRSVGSLESRVLSSARKLRELSVTTEAEIESPPLVEIEVRAITSPELKTATSVEMKENSLLPEV